MSSWTSSGVTSLRDHASCQLGLGGAMTPPPWSANFFDFAASRGRNHLAKDGIAMDEAQCHKPGDRLMSRIWAKAYEQRLQSAIVVVLGRDDVHSEIR